MDENLRLTLQLIEGLMAQLARDGLIEPMGVANAVSGSLNGAVDSGNAVMSKIIGDIEDRATRCYRPRATDASRDDRDE